MVTKQGVLPYITITKSTGGTFVYDPFTPTFDFALLSCEFREPTDATGGRFDITISAPKAQWDAGTGMSYCNNTLLSNIAEGYEITFAAGKTSSTTSILRGIIESITINEKGPNFMSIDLSGPDFGSAILKHTVVQGAWIQRKQSNGVDLDMTDTNTLIYNIINDMISNNQYYPVPTDGITAQTKGLNAVSSTFCQPPSLPLAQFYANTEFIDDCLTRLDDEGMTMHFVDYNKNLVVKSPVAVDSGILLVDSTADSVAATWDTTKLGYLVSLSYKKTLETHRKRKFGYGGDQRLENTQQKQTTTTTTTKNDTSWLAMKFQPYYTNIDSIGVYVDKVGSPGALSVLFTATDSSGKPLPSTLIQKSIDANKITGTAGWHYVDIQQNVDNNANYWVILQSTNDVSNYYRWYRTSGATSYTTTTSSDGITWAAPTTNGDGFAYRAVSTSPLMVVSPSVGYSASDKHFYEEVIRKPDVTQVERMVAILSGLSVTDSKRKNIVKARVYSPDTIIRANQAVRIRKQAMGYTFDSSFIVGQVTYKFDNVRGYLYMDIEAVNYTSYP